MHDEERRAHERHVQERDLAAMRQALEPVVRDMATVKADIAEIRGQQEALGMQMKVLLRLLAEAAEQRVAGNVADSE